MNGACKSKTNFGPAPWGPEEGSKGQISFNFNYKVNFIYWSLWGAQGVKTVFFFKHGHVAYQIDEDDEQNRMQGKFSS